MDKINVKINNCYGINKLENVFDFTDNNSTHVIYAPNGVMKTSFANVFDDYSKGKQSKDLINEELPSVTEIKDMMGNDIGRESIFVIKSYESSYKSERMSTLLVKEELRKRYDEIHKKIAIDKGVLIQELKKFSGLKKNIEEEISQAFTGDKNSFFITLERLEKEVLDDSIPMFDDISYSIMFDEKVVAFLETGDFKEQIIKYIEKYDELLNSSTFIKKGFNHYNATTIHKNLKDNGFFKADHTINLVGNGDKVEVSNEKEFLKIIESEKEKIFNDSELKVIFDTIDKKITNAELRNFREYLFEHKDILTELINLPKLKQKLWISYLKKSKTNYQDLLNEYKRAKEEINNIIKEANEERTDWERVIDIFNRRFHVPFRLEIRNKSDIILNDEAPSINYFFENRDENIEEGLLLKVLSQGEKRALYLLNIIFEIESRKKKNMKTLFIIDDIADSFDYKNKYAIIEYLKEVAEYCNFYSIILTHNFDFFRTALSRVCNKNKWKSPYMALKESEQIYVEGLKYKYISNPFTEWKKNLEDKAKLIASITFARNITEYTGDEENFNKLTCILHIKLDTYSLKVKDIEQIYKNVFRDLQNLVLPDNDKEVIVLIFELADKLYCEPTEIGLNLENKIVLSIAIRLGAEKFMIKKINDESFVNSLKKYQTGKLFERFKQDFPYEHDTIEILEKVNLMTPENIHLNSFMYEPILDISDYHLKKLFKEVKELNNNIDMKEEPVLATS